MKKLLLAVFITSIAAPAFACVTKTDMVTGSAATELARIEQKKEVSLPLSTEEQRMLTDFAHDSALYDAAFVKLIPVCISSTTDLDAACYPNCSTMPDVVQTAPYMEKRLHFVLGPEERHQAQDIVQKLRTKWSNYP